MKIGFARRTVSDLHASTQVDALREAGCNRIFIDDDFAPRDESGGLETVLSYVRAGDVLVVYRLERLGRSLRQLVAIINRLQAHGIEFQSLREPIDTTSPGGDMVFELFTILARFEHNVIRERTHAGLAAARAKGRTGGRPRGLPLRAQRIAELAESLYLSRELSVRQICEELSISKSTLYNYLRHRGVKTHASTE